MAISARTITLVLVAAAVVAVGVIAATRSDHQRDTRGAAPTALNGTPSAEPIAGDINAETFRRIAQLQMPTVVSIRQAERM